MGDLTHVTVDFSRSHLIFPEVIGTILVILAVAILIRDRRRAMGSGRYWREIFARMDKLRFFGTLLLTVVYFSAMEPVGYRFPNLGLGFLFCSIPYLFAVGFLYLHHRTFRAALPVAAMALVAPTLVWWLFGSVFLLTLP
ncbi:tripartite tricarboxylate transporter TctB family protein [Jiella sonneratiae]|uniref:Tripartite tricarboxylate transporter TctB family protein n=1 Tax=Jiella sonneratiae TaxID=2816856 RepID=A0ABS3J1N6_9HYPH|nr:tripartite tricarboxylate transporter TctB family protein [Jiella sonneratiae]MBO0903007.1 tripartite tricarboxylate transporter TctB family protein [Jiella sonneratiae]